MNIENKTININRGDSGNILIKVSISSTEFYQFITGDKIQFRIFNKGDYSTPIKTKEVDISSNTTEVTIPLTELETTLGEIIDKPKTYWYEISLNEDKTLVGYDSTDGAAELILLPGYVEEGV